MKGVKMKALAICNALLWGMILTEANAAFIADQYVGSNDHGYGDRIGSSVYEVQGMDVNVVGSYLNIKVHTNYSKAGGHSFIDYGDLFISTNGWNPFGSSSNGYLSDNASNGEVWEWVFDTSEGALYSGAFDILNAEDVVVCSNCVYRDGQEVQRGSGGVAHNGSSVDLSNAGNGGFIEYNILTSSLGLSGSQTLGFKWGMTCANDTIEGATTVTAPEPAAWMLLMVGLVGLGLRRRRC